MQTKLDAFHKAGAEIVAISADPPEKLRRELREAQGITFPLLSDPGAEVIEAYGVRHPDGNPFGGDIARPALFIIGPGGIVRWRALTENWRVRPTADSVLNRVREAGRSAAPTQPRTGG